MKYSIWWIIPALVLAVKRRQIIKASSILSKLTREKRQSVKKFMEKLPWKLLRVEVDVRSDQGTVTVAIADPGIFRRAVATKVLLWFLSLHFGEDVLAPVIVLNKSEIPESKIVSGELQTILEFDAVISPATNEFVSFEGFAASGNPGTEEYSWVLKPC